MQNKKSNKVYGKAVRYRALYKLLIANLCNQLRALKTCTYLGPAIQHLKTNPRKIIQYEYIT